MNEYAKHLFQTSFDEDDDAVNPEIEAAFAAGREAGIEAARANSEQSLEQSTAQIVAQLSSLESLRGELGSRMTQQAVQIANDLVRKMMPAFVANGGLAEIEAVLSDALQRMLDEPRVVFRVPDATLDELQPRIAALSAKAGYTGDVVLIADQHMGLSDCLVEWADGGAERNLDRLWLEIEEIFQRALDASPSNGRTNGGHANGRLDNGGQTNSGQTDGGPINGSPVNGTQVNGSPVENVIAGDSLQISATTPTETPSQPVPDPDAGATAEPIQE